MSRCTCYSAGGAAALCGAGLIAVVMQGTGSLESASAQSPRPEERTAPEAASPSAVKSSQFVQPQVENRLRSTTQPAHVEPYERAQIFAKAAGYLSEVNADIGDRVKKGQVLATIWIPEMEQQRLQKVSLVEEARAAVEQARASVCAAAAQTAAAEAKLAVAEAVIAQREAEARFRRSEHQRIGQLVANRSMNQAVLDEKLNALESAESALAVAQATVQSSEADVRVQESLELQARADLARAEAQLKVAEADLAHLQVLIGYSQVIAPFDGLVIERSIDTGDFVSSAASNSLSEPLLVVDRDEKLRIVFDVPESQSSLVQIGQRASLAVDALKGRTFEGAVARTAGVLNPKTRTLRAEVELATTDPALRPGMYGMVTIELANDAQALTISR